MQCDQGDTPQQSFRVAEGCIGGSLAQLSPVLGFHELVCIARSSQLRSFLLRFSPTPLSIGSDHSFPLFLPLIHHPCARDRVWSTSCTGPPPDVMDGTGPTIHPPAVVAAGPLFSGVVVNGRKLAAQQREAASIAAVAAAAKADASRTALQGKPTTVRADGEQAHAVSTVATGGADGIGDAEAMRSQTTAGGSGGSGTTPALAAAAAAVTARANGCRRLAAPRSRLADRLVFNPADPVVKEEILSIIVQYLSDEGYASASASVASQARFQAAMVAATRADMRRMRGAILDGDWATVEGLCGSDMFKPLKPFHYAVGRQQYLELIDGHEYQKAFALLTKRLKPLESYRFRTDEFRDLCYLLTCKSVTDACSFRDWNGVAAYRERLVEQFAHLLSADQTEGEVVIGVAPGPDPLAHASSHGEGPGTGGAVATAPAVVLNGRDTEPSSPAATVSSTVDPATGLLSRPRLSLAERVPPHHLVHLLTQALEHQVSSSRYQPTVPPRIGSILSEYECFVVPNVQRHAMTGHTGNVKCIVFVGDDGLELASGSSDNTVALWGTDSGSRVGVLTGHTSRVWDVAASRTGALLASASGDGTVRLWTRGGAGEGVKGGVGGGSGSRESDGGLLHGHAEIVGDTPLGDPSRGSMFAFKAALTGHRGDVYSVELHPNGRHLVTAGYDKVRWWSHSCGRGGDPILRLQQGQGCGACDLPFASAGTLLECTALGRGRDVLSTGVRTAC